MLKNIPNRQKIILFAIIVLLVSVFIYKNNIAPTIGLYSENQQLKLKIRNDDKDVLEKYNNSKLQFSKLKKVIGDDFSLPDSGESNVLDMITKLIHSNNLSLKYFPQSIVLKKEAYFIRYYNFSVEGGFIPLTSMIYEIEKNKNIGCIRSVEFKTVHNFMNNTNILRATIFLQVIKKEQK